MTEELSRTSALASRHKALGSGLENRNGMGTAWSYDAILYNCGKNEYLLCYGFGESMERLQESATDLDVKVEFDDNLHNISVQGSKAMVILNPNTSLDLALPPTSTIS